MEKLKENDDFILVGKKLKVCNCIDKLPKINRIMTSEMKRLKYHSNITHDLKNIIHQGQRKLLLSEIEFLTLYHHLAKTVLYVGSAAGFHLPLLSNLFPEHKFILYDPAKFSNKLFNIPSFEIHNELFTDDEAKKYINWDGGLLFISDIRNGDDDADIFEKNVLDDMDSQKRWVNIIKPVMSSLKMRLSYKPGKTLYFDGDLYIQAFPPISSTETRLFTNGSNEIEYDNTLYEEQMFYFNNQTRLGWYDNPINCIGIDNCYDCMAQTHIIFEYLSVMNKQCICAKKCININDIIDIFNKIDIAIGKTLINSSKLSKNGKNINCNHGKRINKDDFEINKKKHLDYINKL